MHSELPTPSYTEPAEIAQLLDEHHLVVLGADPAARAAFATSLGGHLGANPDGAVVAIHGDRVTSVGDFCRALRAQVPGRFPRRHRPIEHVIELLRSSPPRVRHQYLIWADADVLLEADRRGFDHLVNALLGVAAEHEHVSTDLLVLQRVVFLGGEALARYASDERGQLRSWLLENDTSPFWEVVSCVPRPPVLTYQLEGSEAPPA